MHVFHSRQYLTHEILDLVHGYELMLFLRSLDDFLEIVLTEFEDKVLNYLALFVL